MNITQDMREDIEEDMNEFMEKSLNDFYSLKKTPNLTPSDLADVIEIRKTEDPLRPRKLAKPPKPIRIYGPCR
jgi:hypothetical protein